MTPFYHGQRVTLVGCTTVEVVQAIDETFVYLGDRDAQIGYLHADVVPADPAADARARTLFARTDEIMAAAAKSSEAEEAVAAFIAAGVTSCVLPFCERCGVRIPAGTHCAPCADAGIAREAEHNRRPSPRLEIRYNRSSLDYDILDTANNDAWLGTARTYADAFDVAEILRPSYPPTTPAPLPPNELPIPSAARVIELLRDGNRAQVAADWGRLNDSQRFVLACDVAAELDDGAGLLGGRDVLPRLDEVARAAWALVA